MEASMSAKEGLSLLFGGSPSSSLEIHEPLLEILGQLGSEDVAVTGSDAWGLLPISLEVLGSGLVGP